MCLRTSTIFVACLWTSLLMSFYRWGLQNWAQYSKCGLTRALYSRVTVSFCWLYYNYNPCCCTFWIDFCWHLYKFYTPIPLFWLKKEIQLAHTVHSNDGWLNTSLIYRWYLHLTPTWTFRSLFRISCWVYTLGVALFLVII